MTIDLYTEKQKHDNLHGVSQTTFNSNFSLYRIPQEIHTCVTQSDATFPSLHHLPNMKIIVSIYPDPSDYK